jgi:hypothetical protein
MWIEMAQMWVSVVGDFHYSALLFNLSDYPNKYKNANLKVISSTFNIVLVCDLRYLFLKTSLSSFPVIWTRGTKFNYKSELKSRPTREINRNPYAN